MTETTETLPPVKINIRLHAGQREVARHPARFKVLACGRRWGKTRLGSGLAFKKAAAGERVWWVAPDFPRATIGWRIIRRMALQVPFFEIRDAERRIEFPNGGWLQVKSAHAPGALRGEGLDYVIVDEAAFMDEERWTSEIRPALSDRQGGALFISTFDGENWFYRLFERGSDEKFYEWESWRKPTSDNPFIPESEIEDARVSMSEAEFAQEYLALVSRGVDAIFERRMFERYDGDDPSHRHAAIARYVAWDTAFSEADGADYTAWAVYNLSADYRLKLAEVGRERLAYPDLLDRIEDVALRHNQDGKLRGVIIEQAASGQSALQSLSAGTWLAPYLKSFKPGLKKKAERAKAAAVYCRRGAVLLPTPSEEAQWLHDFEHELFSFPAAENDDMVDAFTMPILYLENLLAEGLRFKQAASVA